MFKRLTQFLREVKAKAAPLKLTQQQCAVKAMGMKAEGRIIPDPFPVLNMSAAERRALAPKPTMLYANPGPNRHKRRHPAWSSAGQPYKKNKPFRGKVRELPAWK
ncbi:MAG TPA: hypothetical protein VMU02_05795 [bacterium]|nr:hypothetical protein [bacterium]